MKTVMKKLLSVALAAILLVSAVPFQASAAEVKLTVHAYANGVIQKVLTDFVTVSDSGSVTLSDLDSQVVQAIMTKGENASDYVSAVWTDMDGNPVTSLSDTQAAALTKQELKVDFHYHVYDAGTVTKQPTCDDKGTKTFKCTKELNGTPCSASTTEDIAALGHDYTGAATYKDTDGKFYQNCVRTSCVTSNTTGRKEITDVGEVTFIDSDGKKVDTRILTQGVTPAANDLPVPTTKNGLKFVGWNSAPNGTGEFLTDAKWYAQYTTYYAHYEKSADDKQSDVKLYVACYVDGVQKGDPKLVKTYTFGETQNVLTWLKNNSDTVSADIFSVISSADYEWPATRYYYNYSGSQALTEQNLTANGEKAVLVKVNAKAYASVYLYIHGIDKNGNYTDLRTCDLRTYGYSYMKGDTITKSVADAVVKKFYTGKNMTIQGLYSDSAWADLKAGQSVTAANGVGVTDNGTVKVHVVLKNATASSTADSTNPKTGDVIFIPAMVMLASTIAIAYIYMGTKKRATR